MLRYAMLSLLLPAIAEAEDFDRFQLFAECRPIELIVHVDTEPDVDATEATRIIYAVVQQRLELDGLFPTELAKAGSRLVITVSDFHGAHSIALDYYKLARDAYSGSTYGAITWQRGGVGYYPGNWRRFVDFVVVQVSRHVDLFIGKYRQVNQAACEHP